MSQLTADPQNAEGAEYAGREEDDEFLASSAVDHHYDDDESAEPEPEAAVGDFGISAGDPEISLDGDAERPETAVLAV